MRQAKKIMRQSQIVGSVGVTLLNSKSQKTCLLGDQWIGNSLKCHIKETDRESLMIPDEGIQKMDNKQLISQIHYLQEELIN